MSVLILVFLAGGQVVLEEDTQVIWASDDDDDFREQFGNDFLDVDDAESVLEYLMDEDVITEEEAREIGIESESLDIDKVADEIERDEDSRTP